MQFTADAWDGIAEGSITVTFRTWAKARVGEGRSYRIPPGVITVDRVSRVRAADISPGAALAAGSDLASLRDRLGVADDEAVWRIDFHFSGPDPRTALRNTVPGSDELTSIVATLDGIDGRSRSGLWTRCVLALIAANPGVRAPDLAPELGLETLEFKRRVRRLKELGLTESLRVGYRLSLRGQAVADHLGMER